ncbi:unnamed protein product [Candidula unifasciata]|uniref:SH2 domain-containing protein n=1 Tax=Candidula unifasciata TaxID=100452 RepID=A0A8S3ZKU4_9EUPU|nr:unnamed protein product [Candidula unifasciata]
MLNANCMKSNFDRQVPSLENLSHGSWDSTDYRELEESIYVEAVGSRTSGYSSDKDEDRDVETADEDVEKPPLPPRSSRQSRSAKSETYPDLPSRNKKRASDYSVQKRVSLDSREETPYEDEGLKEFSPRSKEAITDPLCYWASVYFNGSKVKAAEIVSKIAENGTYLIRKSDDDSNVLLFYAHPGIKKFRILEKKDGCVSLSAHGPDFESVEDMLYYYYSNDMPNTNMKLVTPYKLHSRYQE